MIYIFSKFNKLIETCLNSTQNVQMQETLYRTIQWPLLKPAKRKKIQVVISIKMKIKHVHSQEHKSICHSADHLIKAISNKTNFILQFTLIFISKLLDANTISFS
jgi:hypothetical protein